MPEEYLPSLLDISQFPRRVPALTGSSLERFHPEDKKALLKNANSFTDPRRSFQPSDI